MSANGGRALPYLYVLPAFLFFAPFVLVPFAHTVGLSFFDWDGLTQAAFAGLDGMVGLFAYNIPNCLSAVREANKLGQIKLVSFDEQDGTLQGIMEGHVHGTVSQQPYQYGYESVRVLAALARGDRSVLPATGFIEVPSVIVRRDNVESFWAELKKLRGDQ